MRRFFYVVLIVFCSLAVFAQPGDPTDGNPAPIGGIELLLAGGAILGARFLSKKKKN